MTPGTRLGPYEIVASVGAGGMGEVFRARDTRLGRDVAIKVSKQQFTERFDREARAVASLNHPNICALYDVGPNYLVMEYVEGDAPKGPYPLDEALKIAWQIAEALAAAHQNGITHRDLKPANIKIKADGSVKVLDFGLAKVGRSSSSGESPVDASNSPTLSASMTEAGMILGTAAYMAPEQAKGKAVDRRADVWSFGVVVYELVTGERLFQGDDVGETLAQVIMKEPDLSAVPPRVQRLIKCCLQKNPQQRLHDIADAKLLLDEPPSAPGSQGARTAAGWMWPGIAAVLLVGLAATAFLYLRETPLTAPDLMRFQIGVPEGVIPLRGAVFSPDGRSMVFPAVGADGVRRVYLRTLDGLDARPISGTERSAGTRPFWSPDGRFVAFQADGKLKKVEVTGGAAQTLCDVPSNVLGGSWNRDDVIIFGSDVGGVLRVSAAGGLATPVTAPAQSSTISDQWPSFLPDGHRFIYQHAARGVGAGGSARVGTVDVGPTEQASTDLVTGLAYGATYAASPAGAAGFLLFVREETLFAQPFDEGRLQLTGEAAPIAEGVGAFNSDAMFSVSAAGSLTYRTGFARPSRFTTFDRQGMELATYPDMVDPLWAALSPDGARVAFQSRNPPRNISVIDLARGLLTPLTFERTAGSVWSPDGGHIAYVSNRRLYRKLSNGAGNPEVLLEADALTGPTDWSRDGRFLLYGVAAAASRSDVWALPLDGSGKPFVVLQTEFGEQQAHLSPDGRWIAYSSDESGASEVWVRPFTAPSSKSAAAPDGKWLVSRGGGVEPRWRRDGRELFYLAPDGSVMTVGVENATVFQPGTLKTLFRVSGVAPSAGTFVWDAAADGERFLLPLLVADGSRAPFTLVVNWMAGLQK